MKFLKKMMWVLLSITLVIIVITTVFFYTAPQLGAKPNGKRLERMKETSNFNDGIFHNSVETKMDMPKGTIRKLLKHYFIDDKRGKNPQIPISTHLFDKEAFEAVSSDSIVFVWFGHSTILMKVEGITILADPVIVGERASMFSIIGPKRFDYSQQIKIEDLPAIDAVILSHDHYDHLDYPTILALKDKETKFFIPLGVGAHFEKWGVPSDHIVELNWWDEVDFEGLKLVFTPTRHFSGRALRDRFRTLWGSWVILGKDSRLYFSGDSGYFPGFKEIGERFGPFDLTFMECGAYNEGWSEIHMFPEETAQAHKDLKGKLLLPIHWGKFDLSLHPWKESVERLAKKAREEKIRLFTPEVGEMVSFKDSSALNAWWQTYD